MSKVTFIFANDDGDTWSTPLSLLHEFAGRGWETEIISIGSNRTGRYHDMNLRNWVSSKPNTDVVLFMDWGRFDSPYLNRELVPGAVWVQESGDDPQNFSRNSGKARRFHLTLTPDAVSCQQYQALKVNAHWWTHFADTRIHYPMSIDPQYLAVTSRGPGGSEFLDTIVEHSSGLVANRNGFVGIAHSEFLQRGLMVLQNSRWGEITRRIFEAMACGQLVLTDRLDDSRRLHELFQDRVHIVYYNDIVECMQLLNYYGEHSEERMAIAAAGRAEVLKNHTQIQRVDTLLQLIEDINGKITN